MEQRKTKSYTEKILNTEKKIKRQQQLDQEMREKELRMYENQKPHNIQFTK